MFAGLMHAACSERKRGSRVFFDLCAPCLFGLESIVAEELKRMDMQNVRAENGRVFFSGGFEEMARANIRLRCAERVLIRLGSFHASTFDELFEGTKALPWEDLLPPDAEFPVKGHSINSKLMSIPDCQSIVKKAVVERLKTKYKTEWFEETGPQYRISFAILKDTADLLIDTSGEGLHKRGYRAVGNEAPLRETLAAAMVNLSRYRGRGRLCDPFCGSGTIAIEAALIARNRAAGIFRSFAAQAWPQAPEKLWQDARNAAKALEFEGAYDIWGGDVDEKAISIASGNAKKAGVDDIIRFEKADAGKFSPVEPGGTVVTNPPYGQRLSDIETAQGLYRSFGRACRALPDWSLYLISPNPDFETHFGRVADKKRKLYNGMIQCNLYMYFQNARR